MPVFQDLMIKLKTLISAVAGFFKKVCLGLKGSFEKLAAAGSWKRRQGERTQGAVQYALEKIHEKKPVIAGVGLVVLALVFAGTFLIVKRGGGEESSPAGARPAGSGEGDLSRRFVIPPEELFLPDEPDFIPGVLLERERRTSWTAEDAAPYWQDPLRNGEEQWRERLEAAIDELLERVP
ncbi:MAG: hypothetical protein LBK62_07475 [Treponema sp.]|jgi:hypothetical protein|nr:hypothetical protein [Treponema sp.]